MNYLPSVFISGRVRAAKEHICCECLGKISKGEFYNNDRGCWEGSWATYKVCLDCDALRKEVDSDEHDFDSCTPYESLYESVFESSVDLIDRFLEIKRKRGASIPDWMIKRQSAKNEPTCPACGNNRQVWTNEITGLKTCHRVGCHIEIKLTHELPAL